MLSREYLLKRGYCCGHGCLMCPYEPKHKKDNTNLREEFMSKANSNFNHLKKDPFGEKETKGTYYQINKLEERMARLEKVIEDFMERWGPDVQEKRDRRDEIWDEMVRVVSIQKKHKDK
tara:strand:- start:580 stop:936 length:357 start_codon:yes stop_codon:yes gene_type:complete